MHPTDDEKPHRRMILGRRQLLLVGGFVVVAGVGVTSLRQSEAGPTRSLAPPAEAHGTTPYARLRGRWYTQLTGGDIDLSVPENARAVDGVDAAARNARADMSPRGDRTGLWPDLPLDGTGRDRAIALRHTADRLSSVVLAYGTAGTTMYRDPGLRSSLLGSLDLLHERYESFGAAQDENWYDREISVPLALTSICLLLRDDLARDLLERYLATVDSFTPAPSKAGANLVWTAQVVAERAILLDEGAKLDMAREGLQRALHTVTSGDGVHPDGSFIQHKNHPYTGGYGTSFLRSSVRLVELLHGSPWQVDSGKFDFLLDFAVDGVAPWLHKGALLSPVRGREISRRSATEHNACHVAMSAFLALGELAPPERRGVLAGITRHLIEQDTLTPFLGINNVPAVTAARRLLRSETLAAPPEGGTRVFAAMDRVVHRRPGFTFAIAMSSSRIATYEAINSENLHGWWTGSGATYLYDDDLAQFDDGYWPTVDATRIPGTTVPTGSPPDGSNAEALAAVALVGGVSLGHLGLATMAFRTPVDSPATVTGRKTWFLLGDEIVALGSGITAPAGRAVETVVENRKLSTDVSQPFLVDAASLGTGPMNRSFDRPGWAHLTGPVEGSDIGYVFLTDARVRASRESRIGRWSDINQDPAFDFPGEIRRDYLTLCIDHGRGPQGDRYAYVLLPGASPETVSGYAASPPVTILSNTLGLQAVRKGNTVAASFGSTDEQSVGGITARTRVSVIVVRDESRLSVAISDPSQTVQGTIRIGLDHRIRRVITADPRIQVQPDQATSTLVVDLLDARGQTVSAVLEPA
ncbi:hyaluronate lyase [Promicromonospora umidemergens]|uniref:Polysaccharide lyase 8 family protein n=1 Tax=Promicromonospora umidemergens TaxID=629679 RepID=A0ABP8WMC2_9MICO|nr:polysaccharide lyase 8 family protein [Promicromonospora umidemergens]MCP2283143.1 hyaluronate lyase [Promicromonospora umidemergens]